MTELTAPAGFVPAGMFQIEGIDLNEAARALPARTRYEKVCYVRRGLQARMKRGRFFNTKLFSDPAWDMLLELYAAFLAQRRLSISRLSERTGTPMTTTLRWISALQAEGLAERQPHPLDGRQVFITLSNDGRESMEAYFDELPSELALI